MNVRAAKLALEAWTVYDAGLTIIVHRDGAVGWSGKTEPHLDRLYERALLLTRIALGQPLGALGEGELRPDEISAIIAEARGN